MASRAARRSSGRGSAAVMVWAPAWIWTVRDGGGAGLDLGGAVAAGGADELLDRPAGRVLDEAGDGQGGEHDREVGLDRVTLVVVDRSGGQGGFGHPERLLDLEQPVVGVDHELGGDRGAVRGRSAGW